MDKNLNRQIVPATLVLCLGALILVLVGAVTKPELPWTIATGLLSISAWWVFLNSGHEGSRIFVWFMATLVVVTTGIFVGMATLSWMLGVLVFMAISLIVIGILVRWIKRA